MKEEIKENGAVGEFFDLLNSKPPKIIEKFEEEMERCLNDYWYDLTDLERERYITHIHIQAKEEEMRLLQKHLDGLELNESKSIPSIDITEIYKYLNDRLQSLSNTNK